MGINPDDCLIATLLPGPELVVQVFAEVCGSRQLIHVCKELLEVLDRGDGVNGGLLDFRPQIPLDESNEVVGLLLSRARPPRTF
ncbi:hypothetical protein GN244_ATG04644 [Phytophthora infestans]|uniref:Uncharacterized protein n=1 Tax=Phytophthora infestans TaxID=4787 RepID=A0A833T6A3_PHYIN|nr:hypothetical protein GN244_ATG04644 [Phytophthora infestans]